MSVCSTLIGGSAVLAMAVGGPVSAIQSPDLDRHAVAATDIAFQAAVKRRDLATMDRILHEDFVLALGDGQTLTKAQLLAREHFVTYEQQDEDSGTQTVRVYGDTAIVTARLWLKGVGPNGTFDRRLWFSDTYIRTASGWRYAFAQASLPLPPAREEQD
ncbi:ketosteroid isomerase-like protein [Brevundimonas alba]|uniref:Ketosteroid isomerase-like protein n=1 Tax=Brevundimonas alba TaxID=74314 RepID=A0A7X5YLA6_9CAUL|nr:nuclear transport factor 2 family protein [Brevundimonas alba]NJC41717.1 ketosteroid isomerase-like protein [Brevundimonas alba]